MRDHIMCNYDDRLVMRKNRLERVVTASWDSKRRKSKGKMDVFRLDEDGRIKCRNIDLCTMGGYLFVNPKVYVQSWGTPWVNMYDFRFCRTHSIKDSEKEMLIKAYPEFKWTLEKCCKRINPTLAFAFNLLQAWKRDPNVEYLVDAGLFYLAFNKAFSKMSHAKQMEVVRFIRDNLGGRDEPLVKVKTMMKYGISEKQYTTWTNFRPDGKVVKYGEYLYFKKFKFKSEWDLMHFVRMYKDYEFMTKKAGHNWKDPYWLYPKDLKAMHDKVMKECELIDEAKRIADERLASERERNKKANYEKLARKWVEKTLKKGAFEVFVPADVKTISKQANVLHQCLINADYVQRVIDKRCLLVFVWKDGKPYATAEIFKNGTTGQFYADERKRNIKPEETAKQALDEWLDTYKPRFRPPQRKAA